MRRAICIRSLAACLGIGLGEKGVGEERERGKCVCSFTRAFSTSLSRCKTSPLWNFPLLGSCTVSVRVWSASFFWSSTALPLWDLPSSPPLSFVTIKKLECL